MTILSFIFLTLPLRSASLNSMALAAMPRAFFRLACQSNSLLAFFGGPAPKSSKASGVEASTPWNYLSPFLWPAITFRMLCLVRRPLHEKRRLCKKMLDCGIHMSRLTRHHAKWQTLIAISIENVAAFRSETLGISHSKAILLLG